MLRPPGPCPVSALRRARQTCDLGGLGAAAHGLGAAARLVARLSEWDYGEYEGLTPAAIRARRPGWNIHRDGCPAVPTRSGGALDSAGGRRGSPSRTGHGVLSIPGYGHNDAEGSAILLWNAVSNGLSEMTPPAYLNALDINRA
jgi:hypothetical protein